MSIEVLQEEFKCTIDYIKSAKLRVDALASKVGELGSDSSSYTYSGRRGKEAAFEKMNSAITSASTAVGNAAHMMHEVKEMLKFVREKTLEDVYTTHYVVARYDIGTGVFELCPPFLTSKAEAEQYVKDRGPDWRVFALELVTDSDRLKEPEKPLNIGTLTYGRMYKYSDGLGVSVFMRRLTDYASVRDAKGMIPIEVNIQLLNTSDVPVSSEIFVEAREGSQACLALPLLDARGLHLASCPRGRVAAGYSMQAIYMFKVASTHPFFVDIERPGKGSAMFTLEEDLS